jgi:hypothetical protein
LNENSSKSNVRARTAPQMQVHVQPKAELHRKSPAVPPTNLPSIDENTETDPSITTTNVIQPTKVDIKRDVQILILDDNEKAKHEETPF